MNRAVLGLLWLSSMSSLRAETEQAPAQTVLVFALGGDAPAAERQSFDLVVAARLRRFPSLQVVTGNALQALLDRPETRTALGPACSADPMAGECPQQMGALLKASWLCTGTVNVIDTTTAIAVSLQPTTGAAATTTTLDVNTMDDKSARLSRAIDVMGENALAEKPVDVAVVTTATPLPDLRMPLTVGGGVLAAVGVVGFVGGIVPSMLYGSSQGALIDLRDQYRASPSDDLAAEAKQKRIEAIGYKDAHNNIAAYVLAAAIPAIIVGAGGAAAAYFLWPSDTQEVQP
jgi:hypothetical protein